MNHARVKPLGPSGVFTLTPIRSEQPNGRFSHHYAAREFAELGAASHYVQEHASRYALCHTVRGLHFQTLPGPQTKVVRVARGRILDVVVDIRRASPTFGQHAAVELCDDWTQLHVPPGFAHGFCTLEPDTEVVFRLSDYNDPALLRGLAWNDPALGIAWPCGEAPGFVYDVDRGWPTLAQLATPF
jgi:dTDP-4-dehydrorhamnose 3,5-epimerase